MLQETTENLKQLRIYGVQNNEKSRSRDTNLKKLHICRNTTKAECKNHLKKKSTNDLFDDVFGTSCTIARRMAASQL